MIEVLDARLPDETRNKELEQKVEKLGKKLLFVVNKCDLVAKSKVEKLRRGLRPSVFISSTEKLGTTILKKKILELSRGKDVIVGVVGYPNVGKSSLINALSGRKATRTSSESGHTKGMQKVRVDGRIVILDTPGVFPFKEKDRAKHSKIGSIDYSKIRDPEEAALHLINDEWNVIVKHYEVSGEDAEEILEEIGRKFNKLQKGGVVNIEVAARFLLREWQTGKIQLK